MNSNIRIVATQCSLGTWFVSGIYVYIPCIKEIPRMMMMMMMIIIIISLIQFNHLTEHYVTFKPVNVAYGSMICPSQTVREVYNVTAGLNTFSEVVMK
jgi:hypothetical protein